MEKLISFCLAFRKDIFFLSILMFVFIIFSLMTGPSFGNIYTDCARESYIPEFILQGKVIYKDFFALFMPLSYWFNAVLYFVFGKSFKVLYFYSYINAWFILLGIYLICRIFLKEYLSAVSMLAFMSFFILSNPFSVLTYIFPYSYAMVYAVFCFTYSMLSFLYYMKTDNKKFLYVSFLLTGFIYANKPEFLLCFIPMLAVMLFKREKLKIFLLSLFLMLLPSVLCIFILFLQGFSLADLISYIKFLLYYFNSPEEKTFILNYSIAPLRNIRKLFFDFAWFSVSFIISFKYISLFLKNKFYKTFAILIAPFYLMLLMYLININLVCGYTINLFFWHFPILIVIVCKKCRNLNTLQDKMLFFIAITGILSTSRVLFLPFSKISYAVYFITPLLAFWLYVVTNMKNQINLKRVSVVLIILSLTYVPSYRYLKDILEVFEFKSLKGNIIDLYYEAESFGFLVDFINKVATKDDTVLVLPEGTLLNHITGTKTNSKLYQLTPNHISTIGEENIVDELSTNPPEFIVFTDSNQVVYFNQDVYSPKIICESFAYKICDYVYKNYTQIAEFPVALKVYKHNDKNLD